MKYFCLSHKKGWQDILEIFYKWIRLCRGLLLVFKFNLLSVNRHPHVHTFFATDVIDSLIINCRFKGMVWRKWFLALHTWKSHCGKTSILREVRTHHVSMQARCQEKESPHWPVMAYGGGERSWVGLRPDKKWPYPPNILPQEKTPNNWRTLVAGGKNWSSKGRTLR